MTTLKASEFASQIEGVIRSIFPNSFVKAEFTSNIFASIAVWFAVGKDQSQWINGIIHNDIAHMTLSIYAEGNTELPRDGEIGGLSLEVINRGSAFLIKSQEKYMAYSSMKVPFRKTKGTPAKILAYLEKYFSSFKDALIQNRALIPENHICLVASNF